MKKLFIFFIFIFSAIGSLVNINVKADEVELIKGSKSGILIEETTGKVLYSKNENDKLSPASMTKIMSLLLIYEAIENNVITKESILIANEEACNLEGSRVFLSIGEKISVDEALKCVCIASANDCTVLFATTLCGTEKAFVNKMNDKAKQLGLNNTHFSDSTGLSENNHYSSAKDMAIMAKELIAKYPDVLKYTSIKEDYIRKNSDNPFWLVNTNKLAGRVDGILGLKTGYTSFSGYCITLYSKLNNMGLISVVFGYEDKLIRNSESLMLIRYGYNNYELKTLVSKNQVFEIINKPIYKNKIKIISKQDVNILVKKGEEINYSIDYEYEIIDEDINGKITINHNNLYTYGDITTDTKIKRRNALDLTIYLFKKIFIKNLN